MKIFAVANNYPEHNKAAGKALSHQEEPVFFLMADSALLKGSKPFFIPDFMGQVDYEAHLVVRICRLGKQIPVRFAHRYYDAVTLGVDFTAREMLRHLQENGLPGDISKSFDGSAVIGDWIDKDKLPDVQRLRFRLDCNGETVQEGSSDSMLWSIDELIAYVSQMFTLKTGDLLYTGTPTASTNAHIDDHLEGSVEGHPVLNFHCK